MKHDAPDAVERTPLVQRIRHELKLRDLEVVRSKRLSPGFVSVSFRGDALEDFISPGFDDHVKLLFDTGSSGQVRRDYTPRRFNREACELEIEFALHGEGAASDWARTVKPGQRLLIGGPRGSMIVPLTLDWHLLAGDATALPAISRRLEELPSETRAFVYVLAEQADRRDFAGAAQLELHWASSNEELLASLSELRLPDPEAGFAWGGGEASLMVRLRQLLLDKGVPKQHMRVSAYWKRGITNHHEDLAG